MVEGESRSIYDVLQDPVLARVLNDEGPISHIRELMTPTASDSTCSKF
jgi:hypothetical protein